MEPFSPEDPLARLLGKAKPVEPRPNFTQNVLRAARQLPQKESRWERVKEFFTHGWIPQPALSGTCAAVAVALLSFWALKPTHQDGSHGQSGLAVNSGNSAASGDNASSAAEPDVVTELAKMDQFNQLLAQQDTKSLSDNDVAALLY